MDMYGSTYIDMYRGDYIEITRDVYVDIRRLPTGELCLLKRLLISFIFNGINDFDAEILSGH